MSTEILGKNFEKSQLGSFDANAIDKSVLVKFSKPLSRVPCYAMERRTTTLSLEKVGANATAATPSDVCEQPPIPGRQQLLVSTTQQPPLPAMCANSYHSSGSCSCYFDDAFVNARCLHNIIKSIVFGRRAIDMARHIFIIIVFVYI